MIRIVVSLRFFHVFLALGGVMLMAGCPMTAPVGGLPSDFGATQGGVQDMGFARELIASGQVPPPEAFVVEGGIRSSPIL